jgi:hypothetical protein
MKQFIVRMAVTTLAAVVIATTWWTAQYLVRRNPSSLEEKLYKNLQVPRPRIDMCLIKGGSWAWVMSENMILGTCYELNDSNTEILPEPKKPGIDT